MKRLLFPVILGAVFLLVGASAVLVIDRSRRASGAASVPPSDPSRCAHTLVPDGCPFCNPDLVASGGTCNEHGVPEALCTQCDPALVAAFKSRGDWCAGHSVPESQCVACNPGLASGPGDPGPADPGAAGTSESVGASFPGHVLRLAGVPSVSCTTEELRVRFASAATAGNAGLAFAPVRTQRVSRTVPGNAELAFDQGAYVRLTPPVPGVVEDVRHHVGDPVSAGDVVLVIRSPELARAKADYRRAWDRVSALTRAFERTAAVVERLNRLEVRTTAVSYLEARARAEQCRSHAVREERLADVRATSERELLDARAELDAALLAVKGLQSRLELLGLSPESLAALDWEAVRQLEGTGTSSELEALRAEGELADARSDLEASASALRILGFTEAELAAVRSGADLSALLPLRSPLSGRVVERSVVPGDGIEPADAPVAIADTSRLWAVLDLTEADARGLEAGQAVHLEFEGMPGHTARGSICRISPLLDARTRTVRAWATVPNVEGALRPGMFARARIHIRSEEDAVLIPRDALQWDGCCNIVFVRRSDIEFEPRKVRISFESGSELVIGGGLSAGEEIVTTGSFLLKTEIMKESIGAGCCEVEPGKG